MPPAARYTVVRKLATGGMAEIFLATQHGPRGFEKPVVLKRILAALYADPQFRDMLLDEARIHVGLAHSNIAQLLDLGSSGGRYFLVFELVDGWDLGRLMERARHAEVPIPPELALFVMAEILRGLAYAHSKTQDGKPLGIVHRDVSPQNVLVSDHGEVKITDFGIAKAMSKQDRTGSGVVKGKIAYMSPEQASGKPIDARSDLFSVGTMLYQISTGRRPFDGGTDLEVLYRVQNATFEPPEAVHPGIEPELAAVINKAMRPSPADRYQSAEEMLVAIERLLRSVFQPAGQTELKSWLQALSALDGEQPISQAPIITGEEPTTAKELRAGNTLVLDGPGHAKRRRSSDLLESAPTVTMRTGPTLEDLQIVPPEDAPPEARLQAESRRHGKTWAAILGVIALAGGIAFWRLVQREEREAARENAAADAAPAALPSPTAPPPAAAAVDAAARPVTAEEPPPAPEPEFVAPAPPAAPTLVPPLAPPTATLAPGSSAHPAGTPAKAGGPGAPPNAAAPAPEPAPGGHPWRSPETLPQTVTPPPAAAPPSSAAKDPPAAPAPPSPPVAPPPAPAPAPTPPVTDPAPAPAAAAPAPAPAPPAPSSSSERG